MTFPAYIAVWNAEFSMSRKLPTRVENAKASVGAVWACVGLVWNRFGLLGRGSALRGRFRAWMIYIRQREGALCLPSRDGRGE